MLFRSEVKDFPFEILYPTTVQPTITTHAWPIAEMMSPGIQASNTLDLMPNPVFPPLRYTTPPMLGDTSITQHVQLPFFTDLQSSLTIPVMPPPSFMGHLPRAQLQRSQFEPFEWDIPLKRFRKGYEAMFRYWISVARPRKYVTLILCGLFPQSTTISFHHHYLTLGQY